MLQSPTLITVGGVYLDHGPSPSPSKYRPSSASFYSLDPAPWVSTTLVCFHVHPHLRLTQCRPRMLTPIDRWRSRRQSVKELRKEEFAVHEEYRKMRAADSSLNQQPPSYNNTLQDSGESVPGAGMRTVQNMGRTASEWSSDTSGSTR